MTATIIFDVRINAIKLLSLSPRISQILLQIVPVCEPKPHNKIGFSIYHGEYTITFDIIRTIYNRCADCIQHCDGISYVNCVPY